MPRPQNTNLNFNNLIVLLSKLKRQLDAQMEAEVHNRGHLNFKSSHLPIYLLLFKEGSTAVQISEACGVSKQATSKLLKEMASLGFVKNQVNKEDRRSTIVLLSAKGKRTAIEVRKCLNKLTDNYKSLMGRSKYEHLVELLDVLWILHE